MKLLNTSSVRLAQIPLGQFVADITYGLQGKNSRPILWLCWHAAVSRFVR